MSSPQKEAPSQPPIVAPAEEKQPPVLAPHKNSQPAQAAPVDDGYSRNEADDCSEISAENKVETPAKPAEVPMKPQSAKKASVHQSPAKASTAKKSKAGSGQKGLKDAEEADNLQVMHRNLLALLSSSANLADDDIAKKSDKPEEVEERENPETAEDEIQPNPQAVSCQLKFLMATPNKYLSDFRAKLALASRSNTASSVSPMKPSPPPRETSVQGYSTQCETASMAQTDQKSMGVPFSEVQSQATFNPCVQEEHKVSATPVPAASLKVASPTKSVAQLPQKQKSKPSSPEKTSPAKQAPDAAKVDSSSDNSSSSGSSSNDDSSSEGEDKPRTLAKLHKKQQNAKLIEKLRAELARREKLNQKGGVTMTAQEKSEFMKKELEAEREQARRLKKEKERRQELKRQKEKEARAKKLEAKKASLIEKKKEMAPKQETEKKEQKLVGQKRSAPALKDNATPKKKQATPAAKQSDYKERLVEEFAKRWNYALPAYPPTNFDYKPSIESNNLQVVPYSVFTKLKHKAIKKFNNTTEESKTEKSPAKGAKKDGEVALIPGKLLAHEVDHYPGIFKDFQDKLHDLRPHDVTIDGVRYLRPSLRTFQNMPKDELKALLLKAIKTQISELNSSEHVAYDANYEAKVLAGELARLEKWLS